LISVGEEEEEEEEEEVMGGEKVGERIAVVKGKERELEISYREHSRSNESREAQRRDPQGTGGEARREMQRERERERERERVRERDRQTDSELRWGG
jgi:hypothetical protein